MANVITIDSGGVGQGVRINEREKIIRYNVVIQAGNYVQAVRGQNIGEVLDLTKVVGAFREDQNWGLAGPQRGYPLQGPGGFSVSIMPGADNKHWLLKVWGSAGNEHAAGAYEAAITGDLDFYIEFSARRFD